MERRHTRARSRNPPRTEVTKCMLRPGEQRLIEIGRKVGYGWIRNIPVRNGELILEPKPKVRRKHRLGKPDQGRFRRPVRDDFKLKDKHRDLITKLRAIRNGVIVSIEIQDGLPVDLIVEEDADV